MLLDMQMLHRPMHGTFTASKLLGHVVAVAVAGRTCLMIRAYIVTTEALSGA